MRLLSRGDKVGIVACSNGLDKSNKMNMEELEITLNNMGIEAVFSDKLYNKVSVFNGTGEERGKALMNFFNDFNIKAIFDVSGGDLANGVLEYLDFNIIKKNQKPFFGYSDLSVLLNSIYCKANIKTYLYQIRNLIGANKEIQYEEFKNTFIDGGDSILNFNYEWIQGNSMEGIVIGGNIRCFLKLAGTEYIPDFKDKILFIESLGGDVAKMATYLTQYKQLGAFKKIKGIILGTYTEMETKNYNPNIINLVKNTVNNPNIPIIKTQEIGHGQNSKCIIIGESIKLNVIRRKANEVRF